MRRWLWISLFVTLSIACDRRASSSRPLVVPEHDAGSDLGVPATFTATLRLLAPGGSASVSPRLVGVDGDQLVLALVATDPGALLGYAFHMTITPAGVLSLQQYEFGPALRTANAETIEKLRENAGRLIGASVRFGQDGRSRAPAVQLAGEVTLVTLRMRIGAPGVYQIRFPAPHHEARGADGEVLALRFIDAELRIEVSR